MRNIFSKETQVTLLKTECKVWMYLSISPERGNYITMNSSLSNATGNNLLLSEFGSTSLSFAAMQLNTK